MKYISHITLEIKFIDSIDVDGDHVRFASPAISKADVPSEFREDFGGHVRLSTSCST